jgi:hypothetical protein
LGQRIGCPPVDFLGNSVLQNVSYFLASEFGERVSN